MLNKKYGKSNFHINVANTPHDHTSKVRKDIPDPQHRQQENMGTLFRLSVIKYFFANADAASLFL